MPLSSSASRLAPSLLALLSLTVTTLAPRSAGAVGTRWFQLETLEDLRGGDLTAVSVDTTGTVRPGLRLDTVALPEPSSVWCSLVLADGSVLLGTGSEGNVYRVAQGQATLVASTGELAVSSLSLAWDGALIAGTFPEGKLYRLDLGSLTGGKAAPAPVGPASGGALQPWMTLEQAEDVWSLAYDPGSKALYAATGPEGRLYRIDAKGKAELYFDSDEPHLLTLALGERGTLFVGSHGKALIYKLEPSKEGAPRVSVVHDFDADEVKSLAVSPKTGELFAAVNRYPEAFQAPKRPRGGTPTPQPTKPARPGKGRLVRFDSQGVLEELLSDDESHFVSLALGPDERTPHVGTGSEGRVYAVDEEHVGRIVADTDARQVGAMVLGGRSPFVATSDPVQFRAIRTDGKGAEPIWTSRPLDAGLRAHFGRVSWKGRGDLRVQTRSGFTALPDSTWSPWSPSLSVPGDVQSPPGRFVQVRALFGSDPDASLREVGLSFVTDNLRPIVSGIDAVPKGSTRPTLKQGVITSGAESPKPSPVLKVSWKVENPDQDELRYRVSYRREGEGAWRNMLKPGEKLSRPEYEWEVSTLPEGAYRILVEASDEPSNAASRVRKHQQESRVITVDVTPPVFDSLRMQGRTLSGELADGAGPLLRLEWTLAGTEDWRSILPLDGVLDEARESFSVDLSGLLPPGPQLLLLRAWDAAGNLVTKDLPVR